MNKNEESNLIKSVEIMSKRIKEIESMLVLIFQGVHPVRCI